MNHTHRHQHRALRAGLLAVAVSSALVLSGCAQTDTPQAPTTTDTTTADAQEFYGQQVTLTGTVGQVISPSAFTMVLDESTADGKDQEVLVLTRTTQSGSAGSKSTWSPRRRWIGRF